MSFRGEVGIFDGGQQAEMAKDLLQFNKINPGRQQMRCITVALMGSSP